jgi:hypothetical protein
MFWLVCVFCALCYTAESPSPTDERVVWPIPSMRAYMSGVTEPTPSACSTPLLYAMLARLLAPGEHYLFQLPCSDEERRLVTSALRSKGWEARSVDLEPYCEALARRHEFVWVASSDGWVLNISEADGVPGMRVRMKARIDDWCGARYPGERTDVVQILT